MRKFIAAAVAGSTWAAATALAGETNVTMAGSQFAPAMVSATPGDVIVFVNDDSADHDVFSPTIGFGIDLGAQEPGASKRLPVAKAGTFEVRCVFHPHMKMTVSVAR